MAAINLAAAGRAILYRPPSTGRTQIYGAYAKMPSYEKGQYPDQLKPYAGQIRECPVKCKGRKGQAYRECLRTCASSVKKNKRLALPSGVS